MLNVKSWFQAFAQRLDLPEWTYKLTLILLCGLVLSSLGLFLTGCASSPAPTRTVTEYATVPLDMVKDIQMPPATGDTNEAMMDMIEAFELIVEGHNVDQEAVRAVIREHQAKNGER